MPTRSGLRRRGEPLVAKVLEATLDEVARVGPDKLSIEEVAARAGVNKTTIYRRWPNREALALSAFEAASWNGGLPDTGSLAGDLRAYLYAFRDVCRTPAMLAVLRMQLDGEDHGELGRLVRERISASQCAALLMFTRALARGELPPGIDTALLRDALLGSAQYLALAYDQPCSDAKLDALASLILVGSGCENSAHALDHGQALRG